MYTIPQLVSATMGLLQSYQSTGQVDYTFLKSRIKQNVLLKYKTQETWIPHCCKFRICDRKVELPCKTSDLIWVDLLDTDGEKVVYSGFMDRLIGYKFNNTDKGLQGFYDLYGKTLKFYSDEYNDRYVRVYFKGWIRDEETGEIVVPDEYVGSITKYAAAEWLSTTGVRENLMLADKYFAQANQERNLVKGDSNKASVPEIDFLRNSLKIGTYAPNSYRYINTFDYTDY